MSGLDESDRQFFFFAKMFRELEDIFLSFFVEEKVIWAMTMPDGCKGLGGVDVLNKYFWIFSQVVVNRRHRLLSQ